MRRRRAAMLLVLALAPACLGCGQTFMVYVPPMPFLAQNGIPGEGGDEADPRVQCEFMTVLIDYSREGMGLSPADVTVASRVANAMTDEFESIGTHVTNRRSEAYWSLMILASNNERHDGYIFSALLASRNMREGAGPGLASYGSHDSDANADPDSFQVPSMYNGLSYGPYTDLEDQAREYVRRAYEAVFPAAKQLCDFEASDKAREAAVDAQLPNRPEPL